MSTSDLSLVDNSTGTNVAASFSMQENTNGSTTWLDSNRNVGFPRRIVVGHTMKKPGAIGSDRHQVLLQDIRSTNSASEITSINAVFTLPRSIQTETPETQVLSLMALMTNFLTANNYANLRKIVRGGTP